MPKDRKTDSSNQSDFVVTSQQSRFHADASAAPGSKDVDIKDLNISIGGRDILTHAELKLRENVHYVLVGRNGTGKSTLLRALGENRIPGISWNISVLLLGQTTLTSANVASSAVGYLSDECTVLEYVVRSDSRRERALREVKTLSVALENDSEPAAVIRAIRQIEFDRLERSLAEMKEIATRRSGARGAKARKDLIKMEEMVAASASRLEQSEIEIDPTVMQNETSNAVDTLAEIQSILEAMDSSSAEARARHILLGLRFSKKDFDRPFMTLSGGWRTRCSLACALFQKVDILLLDECTNFLDLPAVMWLETYIRRLEDTTVVVVTHDHDFADAIADEVLVLRECGLEHFRGNLSAFERDRASQRKYMSKMKNAQERKTKHMEETIDANVRAAKRTGDDNKLKQAASRRKKIDERTGLEVGLRGGRFKLNRDLAGYHTSNRSAIEIPTLDPFVRFSIPATPPSLRFPGALVSMRKVSFAYPETIQKKQPPIIHEVDLVIHLGERVGIAGLNGAGKSTLVGLAIGTNSGPEDSYAIGLGLQPTKGTVTRHSRARIGCFSQHAVEELEIKGVQDRGITALSELITTAAGALTEPEARALLGSLGLPGRIASEIPIAALSGGQKVRLALAKIVYIPPHLLILDEVTTHLDSGTVMSLIESLREFEGALMVITHDRFFMRCVVEGSSPEETSDDSTDENTTNKNSGWHSQPGAVYHMTMGHLQMLDGGMGEYEVIASQSSRKGQTLIHS